MTYETIVDSIYGLISAYTGTLTIIPNDYVGTINAGNEFAAVQILVPSTEIHAYSATKKYNGTLMVAVFAEAGRGDKRVAQLIDELDTIFQGTTRTPPNSLQFMESSFTDLGRDPANSSLRRVDYMVPFTFYGDL